MLLCHIKAFFNIHSYFIREMPKITIFQLKTLLLIYIFINIYIIHLKALSMLYIMAYFTYELFKNIHIYVDTSAQVHPP